MWCTQAAVVSSTQSTQCVHPALTGGQVGVVAQAAEPHDLALEVHRLLREALAVDAEVLGVLAAEVPAVQGTKTQDQPDRWV
jgi:hypothetical protein